MPDENSQYIVVRDDVNHAVVELFNLDRIVDADALRATWNVWRDEYWRSRRAGSDGVDDLARMRAATASARSGTAIDTNTATDAVADTDSAEPGDR